MANPLVLEVIVNDKGNPVLKGMNTNINKMNKTTKNLGITMNKVFGGMVMFQALAKFRQAVSFATREVFEFNKIFKQTEGITGTSGKALDILKQKVVDVSNVTEHTSTALAKATLNISKMGFTLEQSLEVIPHLANLATSSTSDLEGVTQIAVQTMKSFQLEATDMEHIVNVIQGTVSKTAIGFDDFAESMKFVAPIAKTMNISLEQTAAMIGVLGDIGIKGSLGGTTLKNMFLNIMKPSEKVRKVISGLNSEGLTFNKILKALNDNNIPINDFLETFNKRAVAGSLALSQLTEKTEALEKVLVEDGVKVREVAATIREAWIPQLQILRNTFTNTFVVMGEILNKSNIGLNIAKITEKFIELQVWLHQNPEALINFARELAFYAEKIAVGTAKAFTALFKNFDLIKKVLKFIIAMKAVTLIVKITTSLKAATSAAVLFRGALLSWQTAIPVIGQISTVIFGLGLAFKHMADEADKARKKAIQASWGVSEGEIMKQIDALETFKTKIAEVSQAFSEETVTADIGGVKVAIKESEMFTSVFKTKKEAIDNLISELSKEYGMTEEFFKVARNNTQMFIDSLIKKLSGVRDKANEIDEINKKLKDLFKKPPIDEKAVKGDKEESWWEVMYDRLIASYNVAINLANVINNTKVPVSTALGAFGGQIQGATGASNFIPMNIDPENPQANVGQAGAFIDNMIEKSVSSGAINPILANAGINQDALAMKLTSDEKSLESTKKTNKAIAKSLNDLNQTRKDEDIAYNTWKEEYELAQAELRKERIWEQVDMFVEATQMQIDMIQMIYDAGYEKRKAQLDREQAEMTNRHKMELLNVQNNAFKKAIIEKKQLKEKQKIMKEQERLEKEQKEKQRAWSMIEVMINTAVGVSAALRGSPPASYVLAGITLAMGIAQLALIASQDSYQKGGFTGRGSDTDVAGTVHKNEFVVDANTTRLLGGEEGVDQMIEDRINDTVSVGGGVNVFVESVIGEEEYVNDLAIKVNRSIQRIEG